jgi:hypothetical protein
MNQEEAMPSLSPIRSLALFTAATALLTGAALAEDKTPAGHIKAAYTRSQALPIADKPGHVLLATESKGKNTSTGGQEILNGWDVTVAAVADMEQGNGPYQGYVTFSKDDKTAVVKLDGKVTTVMAAGQPMTTIAGNFVDVSGPYVGKAGTFKTTMTSESTFVADWRENSPVAATQ